VAVEAVEWKAKELDGKTPTLACIQLGEAKRRYEAHFVSKLTDCDGECNETDSSLDFAKDCQYITTSEHGELVALNQEVGRMLGSMMSNPAPFLLSPVP
jgi:hypothetical protein